MKDIVNLVAIKQSVDSVRKVGKDVVISEDAAAKILAFEEAYKLMGEAREVLKEHCRLALDAFNSNSLRSSGLTISLTQPRADQRYTIEPGHKREWGKQRVSVVVDPDKIEKFITENGTLPEGVTMSDAKPSVRFLPKK